MLSAQLNSSVVSYRYQFESIKLTVVLYIQLSLCCIKHVSVVVCNIYS